jgi:hypothetical protein
MGYIVVGPYITARTGGRIVGFTAGAPLPPDVPDWNVQHLLRNNLIADADRVDELVAARPGEPTGPFGRSGLAVDQLVEDDNGLFSNAYVQSGATTADPEFAARAKADAERASVPRPDPSVLADPQERLDAEKTRADELTAHQEAVAAAQGQAGNGGDGGGNRPAQNEPKAAWVDYATAEGTPNRIGRAEAESLSKEALVGRFGAKR